IALLLIAWRLLNAHRGGGDPGTAARVLLALLLVAIVLARFHTLNGLAAGTTLLLLMAGMKLLETHAARDQFVMVAAGLFLLLAACLDRQELARAPLYGLQAWLCCAALAVVAAPMTSARAALSLAGRALLLAVPLALLLFVFFPRLPRAFWSLPRGVLGQPAWRSGVERALRHHDTRRHRPPRDELRPGLPGAVPGSHATAPGALLARPGTARLRWPDLAGHAIRAAHTGAARISRH